MSILLLIFMCYVAMASTIEAIMYSKLGAEAFKKTNEHVFIVLAAIFYVFSNCYASTYTSMSVVDSFTYAAICALVYTFWHDGIYYEVARRINRPDYRFNSNSKTSTADIEVPWTFRVISFATGGALYLIYNFLYQS